MTEITKGTQISAPVVPPNPADTHPTHSDTLGRGGYRSVETIAERDAIPEPRRKWGMKVNVTSDPTSSNNKEYVLTEGHDDNDINNNANFKSANSSASHNELTGLEGGKDNGIDPIEMYHLDQNLYNKIVDAYYDFPTVSLTPATVGTGLEVGDDLAVNQIVNVAVTFTENILNEEIVITGSNDDGTKTPIPSTVTIDKTVNLTARGNTAILTGTIRDNKDANPISDSVNVFAEYAVAYIAFPVASGDLMNEVEITDADLIDIMNGAFAGTEGQEVRSLRANKAIGNVLIEPIGPSNIAVMVPSSYGKPKIAPQAFPSAFVTASERTFTYSNNGLDTSYILVMMDDQIAGNYPATLS